MLRQTSKTVVSEVDRLLEENTEGEVSDLLNSQGMISGEGKRFNRTMVARVRSNYGLDTRHSRLRARGMLTVREIATRLDVCTKTVNTWRRAGLLRAHRYDDKGQCLYEPPGPEAPIKYQFQHKNPEKSATPYAGRNSHNS
jgi:hypothetical protein